MSIYTAPGSTNTLDIEKPRTKKDFVLLANHLRAYATQFPECSLQHDENITFDASGYKVKCQPNAEAIRKLADKLSKGVPRLKTWSELKLPCTRPFTEKQRYDTAQKYKREAEKLYTKAQCYPYQADDYIKQARELERHSIQIDYAGGGDQERKAA